METGYLNKYFTGVVIKKLSVVETDSKASHQHEYNAKKPMDELFGIEVSRREYKARFLYLNDLETISAEGKMTWYDARSNHPTRTEWRFYFQTTEVSKRSMAGDSLFICKKTDDTLLVIIARENSTSERQLYWLFGFSGIDTEQKGFVTRFELNLNNEQLEFVAANVLEEIGIVYENESVKKLLEPMLNKFAGKFPSTRDFSDFARETVKDVDPLLNPDDALVKWINREEMLFKVMEEHLIKEQLEKGFFKNEEVDVDSFIRFSLSVQNRRKSRAGLSLENHIEALLQRQGILYTHTPVTENKAKPDFIFPCIEAYRDEQYEENYLTMLGAKSTCKDRWRQVLSEADRISRKHLLTLEPSISTNQTDEMIAKNLQLVVPQPIHETYTEEQRVWLFDVDQFIDEVKEKQRFYIRRQGA